MKQKNRKITLMLLITSPIFIAMSPTAYTEIPALSIMMLSLYIYLKKRFYFSGVLLGISVFFKEIGLFMLVAFVMDMFLSEKHVKSFIKPISGFLTVFIPLAFSYYIFTDKVWFLDFFFKSSQIYSPKFSLIYDFVLRRFVFLLLLGIGIVYIANVKKLKKVLKTIPNVIKYYLLIAFAGYFLFPSVSPRFTTFFLPVFFLMSPLIEEKYMKFLLPLLCLQALVSIYAIHIFTEPFRIEKSAMEFVINNFSEDKIYGFGYPLSEELKQHGFEVVRNISSANIVFLPSKHASKNEFKTIRRVKIPCTLRIFRMLGCKEKEYVIAVRKTLT